MMLAIRNAFRSALATLLLLSFQVLGSDPAAVADPLAAVDRNRLALVADIVAAFKADIAKAAPGREPEEAAALGERLSKLRADRLLAASLVSSYASLQSILEDGATASPNALAQAREKVLGDPNRDLVYTPLTPCRLIDTRGFGAPIQGGAFAPNERRPYVPNGACGLPLSGVVSMLISFTTQNLTPNSGGYLAIVGPGAPIGATVDVFNTGSTWSASNTAVATGSAAQFDVFVNTANAHVVVDILGYFSPAIGGGGSGGGTVTNVSTGAGLTGGPITTSGTISIAPGGVANAQLGEGAVSHSKLAVGALPQTYFNYTNNLSAFIPAGSIAFVASPPCPGLSYPIGGGCSTTSSLTYLTDSYANASFGWTCAYRSTSASTQTVYASAICMNIPAASK